MELGIYTFGDITPDPNTGRAISTAQRYAEILAAAKLADESGLHLFGVGEPLGPPDLIAGGRHGCDCGRNEAHPSEQRRYNPLDPRSSPGLSGLRDRGPPFRRPRRADRRPRRLH